MKKLAALLTINRLVPTYGITPLTFHTNKIYPYDLYKNKTLLFFAIFTIHRQISVKRKTTQM